MGGIAGVLTSAAVAAGATVLVTYLVRGFGTSSIATGPARWVELPPKIKIGPNLLENPSFEGVMPPSSGPVSLAPYAATGTTLIPPWMVIGQAIAWGRQALYPSSSGVNAMGVPPPETNFNFIELTNDGKEKSANGFYGGVEQTVDLQPESWYAGSLWVGGSQPLSGPQIVVIVEMSDYKRAGPKRAVWLTTPSPQEFGWLQLQFAILAPKDLINTQDNPSVFQIYAYAQGKPKFIGVDRVELYGFASVIGSVLR